MIVEYDNFQNLTVYNLSTFSPTIIKNMSITSIIKKVEFINSGSIFAIFYDQII